MNTSIQTEVYIWAEEHPLNYENNAYDLKHRCERDVGFYVSQDDIARVYRSLGYEVKMIRSNMSRKGYCYLIK